MAKVFVGHDWAEAHHDVLVLDQGGGRLGGGRRPEGVEGVAQFHALVADHVEDPAEVVVATETDRGLFVGSLVAAGYTVLAINPLSTSRYRERHAFAALGASPGAAPSTTTDAPTATPTTAPCAPWPTASSASSTAASDTTAPTTNTPPGPTATTSPLDDLRPWDV